jgi:hypothetical protein
MPPSDGLGRDGPVPRQTDCFATSRICCVTKYPEYTTTLLVKHHAPLQYPRTQSKADHGVPTPTTLAETYRLCTPPNRPQQRQIQ